MSRDEIASSAEETFPFDVHSLLLDREQNLLYLVSSTRLSFFVYKILDTTPSLLKLKEFHDDDNPLDLSILVVTLSPNQLSLVALLSDQSIRLYSNKDTVRRLTQLTKKEDRSSISDVRFWDDQVCFSSSGSKEHPVDGRGGV